MTLASFATLLEADTGLILGPDLTNDQKQEVSDLIGQHPEVVTNIPGLTQAAQFHIVTGTHFLLALTHELSPRPGKERSIR